MSAWVPLSDRKAGYKLRPITRLVSAVAARQKGSASVRGNDTQTHTGSPLSMHGVCSHVSFTVWRSRADALHTWSCTSY